MRRIAAEFYRVCVPCGAATPIRSSIILDVQKDKTNENSPFII